MGAKLLYYWHLVHDSYWFVPTLMALGAIVLSVVMVEVDRRVGGEVLDRLAWAYAGGPDGARQVLSTIAGSMITVAGVVFSITIVALTLASSQFGPRVLSSFMEDTGNQVVLGAFLSTFLYCLLVLRAVRGADGATPVVPQLSVTLGSLLTLLSLGLLIYYIHHVAVSIQAPSLIGEIARELHDGIEHLFPQGEADGERSDTAAPALPEGFERGSRGITAGQSGYIEAVDLGQLVGLASQAGLVIRLERRPGQFIIARQDVARLWPADRADGQTEATVRSAIVLGSRRTRIQDVEFSFNQLVEVAVRALSPAINDPFTAINCIDQLGAGLAHLFRRPFPPPHHLDAGGELRVLIARPLTCAGLADTAFHQIRQNAAYHVSVYLRLLETITTVLGCARGEEARAAMLRHGRLILRQGLEQVPAQADRDELVQRYRHLAAAAGVAPDLPA